MNDRKDLSPYLANTSCLDGDHPTVRRFADRAVGDARTPAERAVRLFYAVRDEIRYDPFNLKLVPEFFKASATVERGFGFCVPKAILLAAAARNFGIPARLGFADVRNHLSTERMRSIMKTDVFAYHGFTELRLQDRWVKVTPTFDLVLCNKFGVKPIEFDGENDAIFHQFDRAGDLHMEYIRDHGRHADFPFQAMVRGWRELYPHMFEGAWPAAVS